jgi:hypothetical protein
MLKQLQKIQNTDKIIKAKVRNGIQKGKIVDIKAEDIKYNMQISGNKLNLNFIQEFRTAKGEILYGLSFSKLSIIKI